jgi:hypothetical protein
MDATTLRCHLSGAQLFEREQEITGGLEPIFGPFLEAASDKMFEQGRHIGTDSIKTGGVLCENGRVDFGDGGAGERVLSRHHFVEHDAEGEDVGTLVRRPAVELLGRDVPRCAQGDA